MQLDKYENSKKKEFRNERNKLNFGLNLIARKYDCQKENACQCDITM